MKCSTQFSLSVMSDSLQHHGLQHARLPCPSPALRVYPNPCPLSQWCHPTISSSVIPFSCVQSFPASGSFQMSQLFASGGPSIGVSASTSVLLMNIQDWIFTYMRQIHRDTMLAARVRERRECGVMLSNGYRVSVLQNEKSSVEEWWW